MTDPSTLFATARPSLVRTLVLFMIGATFLAAPGGNARSASPAVGDIFVYRVLNGYNNEVRGKIQYRVNKIEQNRVEMSVATDTPAAGQARTEVYTIDGNWLRHPVVNHDQLRDYEFLRAYPAFVLPLAVGSAWSDRVDATDSATGRRVSVRVDGEVVGAERISTPAGSFDTFKVRRKVYAGDWESLRQETHIIEIDWYAPALGRPVKSESKSEYIDVGRAMGKGSQWLRGDWNVFELIEAGAAKS